MPVPVAECIIEYKYTTYAFPQEKAERFLYGISTKAFNFFMKCALLNSMFMQQLQL